MASSTADNAVQVVIHSGCPGDGTATDEPWSVPRSVFPGLESLEKLGCVKLFVLKTGDLSKSHPQAPHDWSNRRWVTMQDALNLATTIAQSDRGLSVSLSGHRSLKQLGPKCVLLEARRGEEGCKRTLGRHIKGGMSNKRRMEADEASAQAFWMVPLDLMAFRFAKDSRERRPGQSGSGLAKKQSMDAKRAAVIDSFIGSVLPTLQSDVEVNATPSDIDDALAMCSGGAGGLLSLEHVLPGQEPNGLTNGGEGEGEGGADTGGGALEGGEGGGETKSSGVHGGHVLPCSVCDRRKCANNFYMHDDKPWPCNHTTRVHVRMKSSSSSSSSSSSASAAVAIATAAAVAPCSICARRSSTRDFWGDAGDDDWIEQCKHVRLSSINDEVAVGIWAVEHGAPHWKLRPGSVGGGQQSVKDAATQANELADGTLAATIH